MRAWATHYLSDRHPTHAGVQHTCPGVGTHLAGEGELLPPANAVGLHRLPAWQNDNGAVNTSISLRSDLLSFLVRALWVAEVGGMGGCGGFRADDGKCFRFKQVESATAALCSLTLTQLHTRYLVSCRASHFSLLDTRLTVCFSCTFIWIIIFFLIWGQKGGGGIFVRNKHHEIHFNTIWKRHCWQCLMFDVSRL